MKLNDYLLNVLVYIFKGITYTGFNSYRYKYHFRIFYSFRQAFPSNFSYINYHTKKHKINECVGLNRKIDPKSWLNRTWNYIYT